MLRLLLLPSMVWVDECTRAATATAMVAFLNMSRSGAALTHVPDAAKNVETRRLAAAAFARVVGGGTTLLPFFLVPACLKSSLNFGHRN